MNESLKNINNYCLYLLVFAASFEAWDPFNIASSFSIARMVTILYFISSLPFLRQNLNFFKLKRYVFPLVMFILASIVSSSLNDQHVNQFSDIFNSRLIQLVILMVFIVGHVSTDKRIFKGVLTAYVFSLFLMASLNLFLGVGENWKAGRLFIFGENPNLTGMKASLAILIVTAYLINDRFSVKKLIGGAVLALPIFNLLIISGSRGALLSMFLGVLVMFALIKVNWAKKMISIFAGVLLSVYLLVYIMQHNEDFGKRLESSFTSGETGGRSHLWKSALMAIEDNFFLGVGNSGLMPEMQRYSGIRNTVPHNIFLEVWLTSGFLGFFFFMVFISRLFKSLYKEYQYTGNVLNLIIFLVILFNMAKSGGSIGFIFAWIFFAFLIASTIINEPIDQKYINENISSI